jgi:glycosyltransferase involved in cell wall biosynthesis
MISTPGITVVIPTYQRAELLARCLRALCEQTLPRDIYEVIVISDGPDPVTESMVHRIKNQNPDLNLHYDKLPQKLGPAAARNFGWRKGIGKLIVFTDDDCIPSSQWLEAYWQAAQVSNEQYVSFTGQVEVPIPPRPTDYQKNIGHLSSADFITANCACTKAALELVDGFDEAFPEAWREDSDLEFRLLANKVPILKIAAAKIVHPVRDAPWGISIREQRKSMFNPLLFKKHPDFYRRKIAAGPVWNYYLIILLSIIAFVAFLANAIAIAFAALAMWLVAITLLAVRRLAGTDVSFSHRLEMIFTSLCIPYLSVYWTLRGSLRYKVFFL